MLTALLFGLGAITAGSMTYSGINSILADDDEAAFLDASGNYGKIKDAQNR